MKIYTIAFAIVLFAVSCNSKKEESTQSTENTLTTPTLTYTVVGDFPHDTQSFTEGLYLKDGKIFESTGAPQELDFAKSHFGVLDSTSGKISVKGTIDRNVYFGEGITEIDGKIYQLTWTNQTCFVYDAKSYKQINKFKYDNKEGWGLTNDGKNIIMSDGTYKITFVNPNDFSKVKEISVTENGYALDKINELEYVDGFIYANVWTTNQILKIDANSGAVVAKASMDQLVQDAKAQYNGIMEMNGIAYDALKKEFLITGKLWPKVFRVKFN